MTNQAILAMLKANLEKVNSINDDYLLNLISVAKSEIRREGITITPEVVEEEEVYTTDDGNLIVMYAAYLYRMRVSVTEGYQSAALRPQGMPYMLRYALNNRLFAQKMGAES